MSANDQPPAPARSDRDAEILAAHVVAPTEVNGSIPLAEPDPTWPEQYAAEEAKIRAALGARILLLEHVGSTSVPHLPAKPVIDILLEVADTTDEAAYVPALEAAGYQLRIREPDWYEHRVLRGTNPEVNLHVFNPGSAEVPRMLLMRDWLRSHPDDRDLYARTKRALAARTWKYVQHYADAKSDVVEAILARASAAANTADDTTR